MLPNFSVRHTLNIKGGFYGDVICLRCARIVKKFYTMRCARLLRVKW